METVGKFFKFIGDIFAFFWRSYFQETGPFLSKAFSAPTSSFFELLFSIFLITAFGVLVYGVISSILRRDVRHFITAVERYTKFFAVVGAWIIVVLIVSMVYEVLSRYLFDAPTKWAFEMAYMLMGTSFMFGIAYCLQMRNHIRVDLVYDHVSLKKRAIIDLVGYTLLIPMLLWLSAGLWAYFADAYRVNELSGESAWNPIIWPFKFSFVIGFILLLMQVIVEIVKSIMVLAGVEASPAKGMEGSH